MQHFTELEGTLWRVAGLLAKRGFVSAPDEARDLIHDFFLEAWPKVRATYDPAQGSMAAYASQAFYRFGRRKLAALNTIRHRLVDLEAIAELSSAEPWPDHQVERMQDLRAVRKALEKLPALERQVLTDFLSGDGEGEFRQAGKYGLSRYAYRDALVSAVGRVAAEVAGVHASPLEQQVLRLLWKEGRTAQQTARLLGIDTSEVQGIKHGYARRLLGSIKGKRQADKEGDDMATQHNPAGVAEHLRRALASPGSEPALEELRQAALRHWASIPSAEHAGSLSEVSLGEHLPAECDPQWLARVYEALAPATQQDDAGERAILDLLERIADNEAQEIGEAVSLLIEQLPSTLHPMNWLPDVDRASDVDRLHYTEDETFRYARNGARDLALHGVTPRAIAECAAGFSLLFARVLRADAIDDRPQPGLPLVELASDSRRRAIAWPLLWGQAAMASDVREKQARGLAEWLVHVCGVRPYVVEGFRCEQSPRGFHFIQLPAPSPLEQGLLRPGELMGRWSRVDVREGIGA